MTVSVRTDSVTQPMRHKPGHGLMAAATGLLVLAAGPVLAQAPSLPSPGSASVPAFGAPIGAAIGAPIGGAAAVPRTASPGGSGETPGAAAAADRGPAPGYATPQAAFGARALGLPFAPEAPPEGGAGRALTLLPSLGLEVEGNDNFNQGGRGGRGEVITRLRPSILLDLDGARVQGRLGYNPVLELYGSDASRPRFLQRFNGQFLASVVPDLLYLDARGTGGFQSAQGGFAPDTLDSTGRNGLVQTTSFQVSPYLLHRFGELGTLQAGYAFQSVSQGTRGATSALLTPTGERLFATQDFTAHALYAVARTGPAFGRFAFEGRLSSTDYDGTGVLDGAWRRSGSVEARYAITRAIAVLGEIGYESLRYGGLPGFRLEEPLWGVGVRLTLSPESAVTLRYNRRGGFEAPSVEAVIGLGGRTRLFASHSEVLTTGAQRAADLLSTTTLDALGNPVDALTGAPLYQPFSDSFLGVQGSLQRIRRSSVTLTQVWPRDNLALTFTTEQQRPVSIAAGTAAFEQRGHTATFSWARALSPETTGLVSVQYGLRERAGAGDSEVYGFNLGLNTRLRPRLNGYVRYAFTHRSGGATQGPSSQNVVVLGLRQSF